MSDVPFWASLDPAARDEVLARLEPVRLLGGEILFREGDPADALYALQSGALGISVKSEDGRERQVARIFPPETVGEMAFLSDAPRSATVTALRDAVLLKLTREAFDALAERSPRLLRYVAGLLADRLRRTTHLVPPPHLPTTFAVIPLTEGVSADDFGRQLAAALGARTGKGVACLDAGPAEADESWFDRLEAGHDKVVYAAREPATAWCGLCARRADHLLFLARPGMPLARSAAALVNPSEWRRRDLVLLQDEARVRPPHASVAALPVDLRLNVREGEAAEIARAARTAAGRALGVVLAGGGARGFAHIGVLAALVESGFAIDLIGGTSIGAIVAATFARGIGIEEMRSGLRAAFVENSPLNDYTLPLVALTRGRKADQRLAAHFGDVTIEDLWLPFFCVSSNLTTGRAEIHRSGPLARALRASIAIPGLVPPVVTAAGILVDGAMMNNIPADVMAEMRRGPVLAVDVALDLGFQPRASEGRLTRTLRGLLGAPPDMPSLVSLLFRTAMVGSETQTALARARADMVLHPPLAGIDLRSWRSFDRAVEIGYAHAREAIAAGALERLRG